MTDPDFDGLRTEREYARYRRCSTRTIERERANGTGCAYIRIGARILYRRADIERFIDAHRISRSDFSEESRNVPGGPGNLTSELDRHAAAPASDPFSPSRNRGRARKVANKLIAP
jgi:hypothetical protein